MIKKIPFTSDLIQIGNAHFESNELVWSDGTVVYGRVRNPQMSVPITKDISELFCGIDNQLNMYLVRKNMTLDLKENSHYRGEIWCYPCWCTIEYEQYHECGYVHLPQGCYKYSGAIVSVNSSGNALVYYDYKLHFLSFGSRKVDSRNLPLDIANIFVYGDTVSFNGNYYSKDANNVTYVYDEDMTLLCTYENGIIHSSDYTGEGTISISVDFPIFETNDTVVDIGVLRSLIVLSPIYVLDGFRSNSTRYNLIDTTGTADVRKMFQLATANDCYITADTPDRDTDGNVFYTGDYVLHCDIVVADGNSSYIIIDSNGTYVYDSGILRTSYTGTTLAVYDSQGNIVYGGTGRIDLYNLEDSGHVDSQGNFIYTGDYISLKPLSVSPSVGGTAEATINGDDITVYDNVTGDILAITDGNTVTVYEDNHEVYDSLGNISTYMQPCEWDCDYTIRRDIRGSNERIVSIGGNVYQDEEHTWHIDGGTIELRDIFTNTLYAEGTAETQGSTTSGTVTIYDSQGQVDFQGDGYIQTYNLIPQGRDQQGNYLFNGSYTIRRDIADDGIVRGSSGNYTIYDNSHKLVATESSGIVTVYTASGSVDWQGSGFIEVDNLVPVRYAGSFLVNATIDGLSGTDTIVTKVSDIYVLQSNRTDIVAREDGSELLVGNGVYEGPGNITVSNLVPQLSRKQYYINSSGIVEQQYPQTYTIADGITLDLATMDITIGEDTYTGDIFGLLSTQGIVFPAGIRSYDKQFFISQDGKKIFKITKDDNNNIESKQYNTIENCFSLAKIKKW